MRRTSFFFRSPRKCQETIDYYGYGVLQSKQTMKQKSKISFQNNFSRSAIIVFSVALVLASPFAVFADRFDDQINGIENEITGYQQQAADLRSKADTLQNALNAIMAEKNALQAQISLNETKSAQLSDEIKQNEEKIERQKRTLNKTIAQMYTNGDTTPIVMLASSKNVGEYITAQQVRGSVRDQMKTAMDEVKRLKAELDQQKIDLDNVIADQGRQRTALAAKESEQSSLIEKTRGEEAAYQSLISSKNSEIASLRAQQAEANAAAARTYSVSGLVGGAGCGGYPAIWCNAAQDSLVDNWGMYNRECVSYTAWKVAASGRHMPYWGGHGNANEWPSSAANDGIATGSEPKVGSVAIMYVGYYGHSMYVEGINSNGTIHVSQFNWGIRGEYSEMDIDPRGLTFIYF